MTELEMSFVEIPLTQGYMALVDAADADRVNQHRWHAHVKRRTVYAQRNARKADGSRTPQYLHTFLTGYPQTDHINGDGLDNRRANLREATHTENSSNRRLARNNTSGYKGVDWHKASRKWRARVKVDRKSKHIGCYSTAEEAARAYDVAARELHGGYASVNFPNPGERPARKAGAAGASEASAA